MKTLLVNPQLGPELNGTLMTPAEFDAVAEYDDSWRYELIHGVLVVNPIPSEAQAHPNEYLEGLLFVYQTQHPQGATLDLTLPERYVRTSDSRRLADRVIWAGLGRLPQPRRDVPTIVVEFVSQRKRNRQRDYDDKRKEYLAVGVAEYWVFDRFQRTLTVFRRKRPMKKVLAETDQYQTSLLPGFVLPVGDILAVADRWTEGEE
ncbi:MAG: Uma2 family endonuclease [Gemmataceae bacterium]